MAVGSYSRICAFVACWSALGSVALAVPILNDPNGFQGISWGAPLSQNAEFDKVEEADRLETYQIKSGAPTLGPVTVDSLRLTTFEGKLGRVTVRYTGKEAHEQILKYLQSTYGPLDRTPGQIAVGPIRVSHGMGSIPK